MGGWKTAVDGEHVGDTVAVDVRSLKAVTNDALLQIIRALEASPQH